MTEVYYTSLSQSLQDLIPLWSILEELSMMYNITIDQATAHSTVFEDNKGCVDLISAPTLRPRSRCIGIKYHHLREHVCCGHIKIKWNI
jgi:hypothetical protein